jgi:hypothetical protein
MYPKGLGIKITVWQSCYWTKPVTTMSRRNTMKQNERDQLSARLRRGAIAVVASGAAAAATVHASPSGNIVLAWPTDLPTLTRQTGEAMFLHNTIDGRTFVYIEPNQGARPAAIDLTDIARPKGEGSERFDASGSFESVFPFGNHAELVWLRQRQIAAALYLSRVNDSNLRAVHALSLQPITLPDTDGFAVAGHRAEAPRVRDYWSIDPVNLRELNCVLDMKQVRAKADATP